MSYKLIIRSLAVVSFVVSLVFLSALAVQCCCGLDWILIEKWVLCVAVALSIACGLCAASKNYEQNLFRKEILAIIGLGLLIAVVIGTLPYLVFVGGCSPATAFFESASGFTTTGATAFDDLSKLPSSLVFYRGMTQCIGGLITIFFFAILLPIVGAKTKSICMGGMCARPDETSFATINAIVKYTLGIYLTLTFSSMAVFCLGGMAKLDAFCYAAAIASTGGFSTATGDKIFIASDALQYFSIPVMAISGMNFICLMKILRGDASELRTNEELRWYLYILLSATALVTIFAAATRGHGTFGESLKTALFHVTSVVTTTGLATPAMAKLSVAAQIVFISLMFCGGCSGSTAGGLKISRILIILKSCVKNVRRSFRPNVVSSVFLNGKHVQPSEENETLGLASLACATLIVFSFLLAMVTENAGIGEIFHGACSNFFNVGINLFNQSTSYAVATPSAKYLHGALMLTGRVEMLAVVALLFPSFWKKPL
ncbi:MAG: hypothetical protein LBI61_00295 [Puniceicoccales bacterium]|jgi:trk system potassium uptake protein TrkH|nr:hypothetical protein [Puniceicoccales bacterium]